MALCSGWRRRTLCRSSGLGLLVYVCGNRCIRPVCRGGRCRMRRCICRIGWSHVRNNCVGCRTNCRGRLRFRQLTGLKCAVLATGVAAARPRGVNNWAPVPERPLRGRPVYRKIDQLTLDRSRRRRCCFRGVALDLSGLLRGGNGNTQVSIDGGDGNTEI